MAAVVSGYDGDVFLGDAQRMAKPLRDLAGVQILISQVMRAGNTQERSEVARATKVQNTETCALGVGNCDQALLKGKVARSKPRVTGTGN